MPGAIADLTGRNRNRTSGGTMLPSGTGLAPEPTPLPGNTRYDPNTVSLRNQAAGMRGDTAVDFDFYNGVSPLRQSLRGPQYQPDPSGAGLAPSRLRSRGEPVVEIPRSSPGLAGPGGSGEVVGTGGPPPALGADYFANHVTTGFGGLVPPSSIDRPLPVFGSLTDHTGWFPNSSRGRWEYVDSNAGTVTPGPTLDQPMPEAAGTAGGNTLAAGAQGRTSEQIRRDLQRDLRDNPQKYSLAHTRPDLAGGKTSLSNATLGRDVSIIGGRLVGGGTTSSGMSTALPGGFGNFQNAQYGGGRISSAIFGGQIGNYSMAGYNLTGGTNKLQKVAKV